LTAIAVTGFFHSLFPERCGAHPLPGELGEAFGLIGIQHKGLFAAIHLADHVALKIVQVRDLGIFFLSTGAKPKSKNVSTERSNGGSFNEKMTITRSGWSGRGTCQLDAFVSSRLR
jgi:hypothetical protein